MGTAGTNWHLSVGEDGEAGHSSSEVVGVSGRSDELEVDSDDIEKVGEGARGGESTGRLNGKTLRRTDAGSEGTPESATAGNIGEDGVEL